MKHRRGQLLVEFIVVSMGLAGFLAAFTAIAELSVLKDKALEAAWAGSRLQSEGVENPDILNAVLTEILPSRILLGTVDWTMAHERFLDSPSARFYNLRQTRVRGVVGIPLPAAPGPNLFTIDERVVMYEHEEDAP